jgi:hypothetical protein
LSNCVNGYVFWAVNDDAAATFTFTGADNQAYKLNPYNSRMFICQSATKIYGVNPQN